MSTILSRAVSATAITLARRSRSLVSRAARTVWESAPPSVAILAFALAGCTHNETTTSSTTATSAPATSNSIIGTWKIQGATPHPAEHMSVISGFVFQENEKCFAKSVMLSPQRHYKEISSACTWTDLRNGHIRVIQNGSATEFKDDVSATQLVLTGEGALAGAGYAFDRVTK